MFCCCSLCDTTFLPRALALYQSLEKLGEPFHMSLLCLDEETERIAHDLELPSLSIVTFGSLESHFPQLLEAKQNRSLYEYMCTCKSFLVRYVFAVHPSMSHCCFLDADLYFFGAPSQVLDELGDASVLLTPHRFPSAQAALERHGLFNAGCALFRNDTSGTAAVEWWSDRVLEWCKDEVDGDRFIDQKYLDAMVVECEGVKASAHLGINAAPWNLGADDYTYESSSVLINGQPLVLFHFHHLQTLYPWLLDVSVAPYRATLSRTAKRHVYAPYVHHLWSAARMLRKRYASLSHLGTVRHAPGTSPKNPLLIASRMRRRQWLPVLFGRVF